MDFETIPKMARKHPINNLSICTAPEDIKKKFISGLAYLIVTEEEGINDRLLYLCRLSFGCSIELNIEDIYKLALEFENEDIEKSCEKLHKCKYSYLVEAFIIANLSKQVPVNMLTAIADIAELMECDKEEIQVIVQVAKSRLLNNIDVIKDIPLQSRNRWSGAFGDYIPREWIVSQRKECITICTERITENSNSNIVVLFRRNYNVIEDGNRYKTENPCVIKGRPQAGSVVKKGDNILIYEDTKLSGIKENITVKAPVNGIVYFSEKKKKDDTTGSQCTYISAYIVSYFDNYNDFLSSIK